MYYFLPVVLWVSAALTHKSGRLTVILLIDLLIALLVVLLMNMLLVLLAVVVSVPAEAGGLALDEQSQGLGRVHCGVVPFHG